MAGTLDCENPQTCKPMHEYKSITHVLATTLREYLSASKLALEFKKPSDWGAEQGHCLGFATAHLLFCVVDAIGSYHRGSGITFLIDKKQRAIKASDFQHFFVLNGLEYYGQDLRHTQIKELYDDYRNLLVHNASIATGAMIVFDVNDPQIFPSQSGRLQVNLPSFHNRSVTAVENFLGSGLAEKSLVAKNMRN